MQIDQIEQKEKRSKKKRKQLSKLLICIDEITEFNRTQYGSINDLLRLRNRYKKYIKTLKS